jgi:uncharacterized protein YjiS (DUF1127 family)
MIPFIVNKNWYEKYWLSEDKSPGRRSVVRALIRAAINLYQERTASVAWINLHRQRARDLEMLLTFGDRELWDLGLNRADIPRVVAGTYRRDGTGPSKVMAKPAPALTVGDSIEQPVGAIVAS